MKLAGDLNSRCRFLVANNAASPDVPIVEYTKEHARKLFMRPLQLLHKLQLEGSPGANIFYLSDVCQTEFMGGIDAEIVPSPAVNGDKEHTEIAKDLTAFLEEIQWVVSQYVLHLVSAAERGHQVEGDVYAEAYFGRWPKGEPGADYHGLRDMLSLFEQMQKGIGGNNAFAREAIEVVGNHLRLAGGTIGEYWRGYDRWAFEVACTVARLFHCLLPRLFPGGDGGTTITDIVQGSSGRLRTLDSLLAEQPFLVRQLFRGLSAEDELFALPLYREHFVHSFHVFMLGLVFLYWRPQEVFPGESLAAMGRGQADVLVRRWFLVSMWHDIAYSLEKGRELAERHIHRLLGKERVRRFRGLLPSMPSLGHLFQVEQLIETLEDATSSPLDANESKRNPPMFAMHNELRAAGIRIRDVVSAVAFDRADHGIWSALLLAHALTCPCHQLSDRSAWDLIGRDLGGDGGRANQMTGLGVLALAKAVMPHHVYSWDWPSMLETFYSCPEAGVRGQFPEATITGANHPLESQFRTAHLSVMDNELGYLLVLTDVLGQLGREASEKASDVPSALNIKLIRFLVSGDPPHVTAVFHYGGRKDGGLDPNKMLKYYGLPALYLGLDMAKDTLEGEIRGDELWLSDGSGSTARPLKPGRLYIAVVTDRDMPRLQIKVRVCTLKS
ncbi:MAG: hypothetical protein JW889_16610 [Verrucomicrobia bacterium]|nr:hypothetical protein [Verrucomicrobiota bacterium]